jgi:hypothetical protein
MRVFLSYALSPLDSVLSARLRAVALAYNIELSLPSIGNRNNFPLENRKKLKDSDAVIVLIGDNNSHRQPVDFSRPAAYSDDLNAVNLELQEAVRLQKPVIALVESANLIHGLPLDQIIVFNRQNPSQHENLLFKALSKIKTKKNTEDLIKALGALGLVALGFLALSEFTESK